MFVILFLILHRSISDQCLSISNPDFKLIKTPMRLRYGNISLAFTMHLYSADTLQRMSARIAKGSPRMGGHAWPPTEATCRHTGGPLLDTPTLIWFIHLKWTFLYKMRWCLHSWVSLSCRHRGTYEKGSKSEEKKRSNTFWKEGVNELKDLNWNPSLHPSCFIAWNPSPGKISGGELNQWMWKPTGQSICCKMRGCHFWSGSIFL